MNPGDVHAIVVGVEKYGTGRRWNLNGPALDAMRFVKWLRDRQVPADNILLLASPLDENQQEFYQQAVVLGVTPKLADSEVIRNAITVDLAGRGGELLFVFWGGHGVMSDGRRRLFPANVRDADLLTFDFELLRGFCQSNKMGGFSRQVFVIDACANYFDQQRAPEDLSEIPLRPGSTKAGVSQFVLFAVRDGQLSKNLDALRSGLFSSVFLEEIASEPGDRWPPDLEGVQGRIFARFEELQAAGKSNQMPSFLLDRDWNGNTNSRYISMQPKLDPPESDLADVVANCPFMQSQTARDELIGGLKVMKVQSADEIPSVSDLRLHVEIMIWVLKRARCEQELIQGLLQRRDPGPHMMQLERVLLEREQTLFDWETTVRLRGLLLDQGLDTRDVQRFLHESASDRETNDTLDAYFSLMALAGVRRQRREIKSIDDFMYPALVFAEKLSKILDAQEAEELRNIVHAIAMRRNVLGELESLKNSAEWNQPDDGATLVFTMRPKAGGLSLRAFLVTSGGKWTQLETDDRPASEEEARRRFQDLVKLAEDRAGSLAIEVVLPREQFGWPVDQWKIGLAGLEVPVGAYYPVVLRWIERLRDGRLKHLWGKKWSVVQRALPFWLSERGKPAPSQLAAKLFSSPDAGAFMTFSFSPQGASAKEDPLLLALNCGTPVALWWRECNADPAIAQAELQQLLTQKSLDELPVLLQTIRNQAEQDEDPNHPGYRLALLYDNPEHVPPMFGE